MYQNLVFSRSLRQPICSLNLQRNEQKDCPRDKPGSRTSLQQPNLNTSCLILTKGKVISNDISESGASASTSHFVQ